MKGELLIGLVSAASDACVAIAASIFLVELACDFH